MAFACTIPAIPTLQQDDEAVRITRWDFEPGAATGWRGHGWPCVVAMPDAGALRVQDGGSETDVPLARGEASMRPAGIEHDVMNGSPHPIAFVAIEVGQPSALKTLSPP